MDIKQITRNAKFKRSIINSQFDEGKDLQKTQLTNCGKLRIIPLVLLHIFFCLFACLFVLQRFYIIFSILIKYLQGHAEVDCLIIRSFYANAVNTQIKAFPLLNAFLQ